MVLYNIIINRTKKIMYSPGLEKKGAIGHLLLRGLIIMKEYGC